MELKSMFDLRGKVCIVTGGAGYIGSRFTNALLAFGAKVAATDIREVAAEELSLIHILDGASWFMKFRKITLPLLRPTTLYVLVTTTINAFQTFAIINLMTGGGPNYASSTLLYQIYKQAFTFREFGIASAEGVILFFCVAVFGVAQFIFVRPKD